jgi:hypothetical protein
MKVEKKNCTLKISAAGGTAYLYIYRGELVDAEFGQLSGLEAALEIVGWNDAEIEMDGICRRQEDVVKLSMEHLLIEAFKRKDEAAELEKVEIDGSVGEDRIPTTGGSDTKNMAPLLAVLNRVSAVVEYVVVEQSKNIIAKNSGTCSLAEVDPCELDQLLRPLAKDLNFGSQRYVTFNSTSRYRYLLFCHQGHCVLLKLKPGTRTSQIIGELEQFING